MARPRTQNMYSTPPPGLAILKICPITSCVHHSHKKMRRSFDRTRGLCDAGLTTPDHTTIRPQAQVLSIWLTRLCYEESILPLSSMSTEVLMSDWELDKMKKSLYLRSNFPTFCYFSKKIRKARKTGETLTVQMLYSPLLSLLFSWPSNSNLENLLSLILIKRRTAYMWKYNIDIHRFYLHSEQWRPGRGPGGPWPPSGLFRRGAKVYEGRQKLYEV